MGAGCSSHNSSRVKSHKYHAKNIKIAIKHGNYKGTFQHQYSFQRHDNGRDQLCDVCGETGPPYSKMRRLPIWGQISCKKHEYDQTPECCGCFRFETREIGCMMRLSDGRYLCQDCLSTSIMTTYQCIPLIHEIRSFFYSLNLHLQWDIPVFLVDSHDVYDHSLPNDCKLLRVRGRTLLSAETIMSVIWCTEMEGNIEVEKEAIELTDSIVPGILLSFGLPKMLLGAILAHEMMHAWIRLQDWYRGLDKKVKEGICEMMAYKWIESYECDGDEFLSTMRDSEKLRRETRKCPIYGNGFRKAKRAVERYGLEGTLNYVAETSKLPP